MGFVGCSAKSLKTRRLLQAASPSALLKLLPAITANPFPALEAEISAKFLQSAAFFTPSQILHISRSQAALAFNPVLIARLAELQLDVIGNWRFGEMVELLNASSNPEVSRRLVESIEEMDLLNEVASEKELAQLIQGVADLEISSELRTTIGELIGNFSTSLSSQSAAQVALGGRKQKFPISTRTAEEISDRLENGRHMANGAFGFAGWSEIPSDVIFGLMKKIKFQDLALCERNQVLSAMLSRKLPAQKFFDKCIRKLRDEDISVSHALLVLQVATQIRGLKSPGLKFFLETLPKKFPGALADRKVSSILLTGYARAGVLPPEPLRSEILSCIRRVADAKADLSDFCSASRLVQFTDEKDFAEISDLLLARLETPTDAAELVNVLLALSRLGEPQKPEITRKFLQATREFPDLSSKRRANAVYAAARLLRSPNEKDLEICRELCSGVNVEELSDHLKISYDESIKTLSLRL